MGGSSGLGLATAQKLALEGYHLILIHRNPRIQLQSVLQSFEDLKRHGIQVLSYNINATEQLKIESAVADIKSGLKGYKIYGLIFSISRGNVKPLGFQNSRGLTIEDLNLTLDAMALSLYQWTQELMHHNLFEDQARIIAFTSEGSRKLTEGYAAVGMAKSALETLIKYMAVAYAPTGMKCNCVQAGVCDTPSLRCIPNYLEILDHTAKRNPHKRITQPSEVANAVYLLLQPEAAWITGAIIPVDGGEHLC